MSAERRATGTKRPDKLVGKEADDHLGGKGGDDTLKGMGGNDLLIGGNGSDQMWGGAGKDRLRGDKGNDTAYGGAGDDDLRGGKGSDFLKGSKGADTLNGDVGSDLLDGGHGKDTFVLSRGTDTLQGFAIGEDRIDLTGTGLSSLDDILALAIDRPAGVKINFGSETVLKIEGVRVADLVESMFILDSHPGATNLGVIAGLVSQSGGVTSAEADTFLFELAGPTELALTFEGGAGGVSFQLGQDVDGDGVLALEELIDTALAGDGESKSKSVLLAAGSYQLVVETDAAAAAYEFELNAIATGEVPSTEDGESEVEAAAAGFSATRPNALTQAISFTLTGGQFDPDLSRQSVLLGETAVDVSRLSLSADGKTLFVQGPWVDGLNELSLLGSTTDDSVVAGTAEFWAGDQILTLEVRDAAGDLVPNANVVAYLFEDPSVRVQLTTDATGMAVFSNFPLRNVAIEVVSGGDEFGATVATGASGPIQIVTAPIGAPSPIDNNDFSLGADGWTSTGGDVTIIDGGGASLLTGKFAAAAPDNDLVLSTTDEGEAKISRVFEVDEGTESITIRYKFITSEVPGGFFGSEFNDYYRVTLRSGSESKTDFNSMNGLGLAAFDAGGAMQFRELTLDVSDGTTSFSVDVVVANVGDDQFDSQVVIDKVEVSALQISMFTLRDIDNTALDYLSVDPNHDHFGGNTRLNGSITVKGEEDHRLQNVVLEIIQDGNVAAEAELTTAARGQLIGTTFGTDKKIAISANQLLFQLSNSEAAGVDISQNGTLSFRVRATASNGDEATFDVPGTVEIMTRFEPTRTYGGADEHRGGDEWTLPSLIPLLEHFDDQLTFGDISNMNGGTFQPDHATHRDGVSVDAWFEGYNARNAATAAQLIEFLNDDTYGSQIRQIYATFNPAPGNAFFDAIDGVVLDDGRQAVNVFRNVAGHDTHFHMELIL